MLRCSDAPMPRGVTQDIGTRQASFCGSQDFC